MSKTLTTDVLVIGGGPAGLAASIAAKDAGADVIVIEREQRLGGILKQCIHDGFGLVRFQEKLSGPEYAERFIDVFHEKQIPALLQTFVTESKKTADGFETTVVDREGITTIFSKAMILATGCRERSARQVSIHGTRPAGIYTAGTAQNFINLMGQLPAKKCVILGSGDIGLIMARRLTLEGAEVVGVYEVKSTPSGLTRNIHQCLNDYGIPLHLSHTVTRVFGHDRLSAVEIAEVDDKMRPIDGTQQVVECDALILSVGLIPENEIAEKLGVDLDWHTKGPLCDENLMTSVPGIFSCGNALHVNDLVDYVSESGEIAGKGAASYAKNFGTATTASPKNIPLEAGENTLYIVPQNIRLKDEPAEKTIVYFRSKEIFDRSVFKISDENGNVLFEKKYPFLRPPEMEKVLVDFGSFGLTAGSKLTATIEEVSA
ncbi:MAG: FAD-dependent oxidoreductase [Clostridia bacterium]|nr:FAD-dependent oxidoreductase [Clostridia bacterium]